MPLLGKWVLILRLGGAAQLPKSAAQQHVENEGKFKRHNTPYIFYIFTCINPLQGHRSVQWEKEKTEGCTG